MVCVRGLIAVGDLVCDSCGKVVKHAERYGYILEEDKPGRRFCLSCSREKGYVQPTKDEKGNAVETFLESFLDKADRS